MKKIVLFISFFLLFGNVSFADGYVAKDVYSTDIAVFINGTSVECYNIDNKVYVVAEEFLNHGFNGTFGTGRFFENSRELFLMQDYKYAFENVKNGVAIRNSIQKLGKTVETDIYLHIYGNIIPTYHFNGKLLVAPEDMFLEAQRIRKTREEYDYYSQKFLIDFYVTAKYDSENRSLNVYTDKETFENTDYLPGVTPIEKYKDYKN